MGYAAVHNTTQYPNQPPAGEDDACTNATCPPSRSGYKYRPSLIFALIPLICFTIITVGHTIKGFKHRTWTFMIGMVIGGLMEVLGYVARTTAHSDPFVNAMFLMEMIVLTFAPVFFCASIYISLGHIVTVYGPTIARVKPGWYTKIFITCDVLSLAVQSGGGGYAASATTKKAQDVGFKILVGAIIFQTITLAFFALLGLEFAWRVRQSPERVNKLSKGLRESARWKCFILALPTATILIFIRCVYRTAEMSQGFHGALARNQTTFMIFESVIILLASSVLLIFHPGFSYTWMEKMDTSAEEIDQGRVELALEGLEGRK